MADMWMPGLRRDPGAHANYERGRNRMEVVKMHYTVGTNSAPIGRRGYFQFLVPRAGIPMQFAPVDALCFDSGEWNDAGPGIELEFYEPQDGPAPANIVTASQIEWGGKIARWFNTEHGIPLAFYDGPRIAETGGFRGFITHRSLIQLEQHTDYITAGQWQAMVGAAPVIPSSRRKVNDMGPVSFNLPGHGRQLFDVVKTVESSGLTYGKLRHYTPNEDMHSVSVVGTAVEGLALDTSIDWDIAADGTLVLHCRGYHTGVVVQWAFVPNKGWSVRRFAVT
jgi:hypothetical protein